MTLKVTFDLPLQVESQIRRTLKRNNREQARRLVYDALRPGVEDLLSQLNEPEEDAEWEAIAEALFSELDNNLDKDTAPLSDYAVSRAAIYEDHA